MGRHILDTESIKGYPAAPCRSVYETEEGDYCLFLAEMAAAYVLYSAVTPAGSTLSREFRFSRSRIIIIFHGFIPLPLGDIVLRPRAGGSPGLMRPGDKLSSLAEGAVISPQRWNCKLTVRRTVITRRRCCSQVRRFFSPALFRRANLRVTFIVVGCCRRQMVLRGVISGHLIAYQIAFETPF